MTSTATAVNDDLATLLGLLACPACAKALQQDGARLACEGCGRTYETRDGVPVFLAAGDDAAGDVGALGRVKHAVLANHHVYDFAQKHGGGRPLAARVAARLQDTAGQTLLDVGGGTGTIAGLLPARARYVWLDNDTLKLRGLLANDVDCYAVLGDAGRLPFRDASVDVAVMMEVSHHLPPGVLRESLAEIARVTRRRFVFLDALRSPRLTSRVLWSLDVGRFPRTESELLETLDLDFVVEHVDRFRVHHEHVICVCRPRHADA